MNTPIRNITAQGFQSPNGKSKGIWLWTASLIATRPDDVLDKCVKGHFTEIYLIYRPNTATISQYQYFIAQASARNIDIHALDGDATWALTSGQGNALSFIDNVNSYNSQSSYVQKFKGIHLDVEPHMLNGTGDYATHNEWNTDKVGTINQWISNSDVWIQRAKSYGLIIGGAFSQGLHDTTSAPVPAQYGTKKVSELMIDRYDYYAIMDYNDNKATIVNLATTEINYATSPKIIIGIETISQATPAYVTFFDDGYFAANNALEYANSNFLSNSGYKGVAMHDFSQFEVFLAPYVTKSPTRSLASTRTENSL